MKEESLSKKSQIQIETANLNESKVIVEKILLTSVEKFNLYDNSHTSKVPDTIRSIVEEKGFGFGLGARIAKDIIYVDFFPKKNPSPKFYEVHQFILSELRKAFQLELREIEEGDAAFYKVH
jgi:hypothetical protein